MKESKDIPCCKAESDRYAVMVFCATFSSLQYKAACTAASLILVLKLLHH
jgi:hypothetical protein